MSWSDGLTSSDLARIASLQAEHDVSWPGYAAQSFATDLLATSIADIRAKWDALSVADLTAWHRIRLDSSQPSSAWTAALSLRGTGNEGQAAGHLYGGSRDRASSGGGVLIESSDPNNLVWLSGTVTITGVRGIHIRDVRASKVAATPDGTGRDGAQSIVISRSGTFPEAGVTRLERIKSGVGHDGVTDASYFGVGVIQTGQTEQLDVIDCDFKGCQTGVSSSSARRRRFHGNDFQQIIGDSIDSFNTSSLTNINSAWTDGKAKDWFRYNTRRNLVNDARFWFEHSDMAQHGTSGDVGGYDALHEFEADHGQRTAYADVGRFSFTAQPLDGSSVTIGGVTWTFVASGPTANQILIGATLDATLTNAAAALNASVVATMLQATYSADTDNNYLQVVMKVTSPAAMTLTRTTSPATNCSVKVYIRFTGGTQTQYNDDTIAALLNVMAHNCIGASNVGLGAAYTNGNVDHVRCTNARVAAMAPDATFAVNGFNYSNDNSNQVRSFQLSGNANKSFKHSIRNSVGDTVLDRHVTDTFRPFDVDFDSTFLAMSGNKRVVFPKTGAAGTRPADLMAGTFGTDANGRATFTGVTNDGSNSRAAFRAQLYAQFKLANATDALTIGASDPATWGAAVPTSGVLTLAGGSTTSSGTWGLSTFKRLFAPNNAVSDGVWNLVTSVPAPPTAFSGVRRYVCTSVVRILNLKARP